MKTVNVLLNTIDAVKNFVNIVSQYSCDMDLKDGSYVIDAKSILGIFSLDLRKAIEFQINGGEAEAGEILSQVRAYIVP